MSLRSRERDKFPHGWRRSGRWWADGLRELVLNSLATVAAAVFVRDALRLVATATTRAGSSTDGSRRKAGRPVP